MKIGDARVSTADQNPELQIDALEKSGSEKISTARRVLDKVPAAFLIIRDLDLIGS